MGLTALGLVRFLICEIQINTSSLIYDPNLNSFQSGLCVLKRFATLDLQSVFNPN